MIIGVLKEHGDENRVAFTPEHVAGLEKLKIEKLLVEKGAGNKAFFSDDDYTKAGAEVVNLDDLVQKADVIASIHKPSDEVLKKIPKDKILIGNYGPLFNLDIARQMCDLGLTSFSLDLVPRTTRAQAMDVLSSMATAAGYKAVLQAAAKLPKFFPMFMTAAGTIRPSKVLILGAGVAGLQAIATARRLGAVVEAFDVRLAAKEEVLSLGAKFVEVEGATDDVSAGGYAVEQTEEYKKRQSELIKEHAENADVVICTAQIPGRKAPLLVPKETVEKMKPGSVIVDLAASTGGNCEVTQNDKTIEHDGVYVIGDSNLSSSIASDASKMFGRNIINFLKIVVDKEGQLNLNFEDELVTGSCLSHEGNVLNERVKNILEKA
ncbi:MAG: Re/Si-specific NAD(P)(+) transhydrogenase subunit alpha [Bacteroidota bacterium]